ncbi:MAG: hypothetical protein MI922_07550 [Bacteroidales bacterium]|nr:hypothetical protein [Bacteroidales bacterium]
MLSFFRKKRLLGFQKDLRKLQNSGYKDIGVNIFKNDQVLVQIMLAKHFKNKDLKYANNQDLCLVVDFNKNRTETWGDYENAEIKSKLQEFIYFEDPKGVHCFVKNVGQNPVEIEDYVNQMIEEVFILQPTDKLRIEFAAG